MDAAGRMDGSYCHRPLRDELHLRVFPSAKARNTQVSLVIGRPGK